MKKKINPNQLTAFDIPPIVKEDKKKVEKLSFHFSISTNGMNKQQLGIKIQSRSLAGAITQVGKNNFRCTIIEAFEIKPSGKFEHIPQLDNLYLKPGKDFAIEIYKLTKQIAYEKKNN